MTTGAEQGHTEPTSDTPWHRHPLLSGLVGALIGAAATVGGAAFADAQGAMTINVNNGAVATTTSAPSGPASTEPAPSRTTSSTTSAPERGATSRGGPLTVSLDYCADLDSAAPDWDVTSDCFGDAINGRGDIRYMHRGQAIEFLNDADAAMLAAPGADFDTCLHTTGYSRQLEIQRLEVGQEMCVRTSEGQHALLTIADVQAPDDNLARTEAITFNVTVWAA